MFLWKIIFSKSILHLMRWVKDLLKEIGGTPPKVKSSVGQKFIKLSISFDISAWLDGLGIYLLWQMAKNRRLG